MNVLPKVFDRRILMAALIGVLVSAPLYQLIGEATGSTASLADRYLWSFILVVALLAGYEFYFAVQSANTDRKVHVMHVRLDDKIPFVVKWVWVYSGLYYVLLGLPLAFLNSLAQCLICIAGGVVMLLLATFVYLVWPTRCPPEWRNYAKSGPSSRLLAFVQQVDQGRNCCPSLHCALATYTASFVPSPILLIGIPILICFSCLYVKQHSVADFPPSLVFGYLVGAAVNRFL